MGIFDDLTGTQGKSQAQERRGERESVSPVSDRVGAKEERKTGKCTRTKQKRAERTREGGERESQTGRVITKGGKDGELLPMSIEDVERLLPIWCGEWCERNNVPDMRKASPLVFRAMCASIGDYMKESRILKDDRRREGAGGWGHGGNCNAYDTQKVEAMWGLFQRLCGIYDKIPFASSFACFCGVSLSYVREYGQTLTSLGLDMRKRTHDAEMDAIRQQTSRDPVGRLAILNNEYYSGIGSASGVDAVSVSLPASGSFGLIECRKID